MAIPIAELSKAVRHRCSWGEKIIAPMLPACRRNLPDRSRQEESGGPRPVRALPSVLCSFEVGCCRGDISSTLPHMTGARHAQSSQNSEGNGVEAQVLSKALLPTSLHWGGKSCQSAYPVVSAYPRCLTGIEMATVRTNRCAVRHHAKFSASAAQNPLLELALSVSFFHRRYELADWVSPWGLDPLTPISTYETFRDEAAPVATDSPGSGRFSKSRD